MKLLVATAIAALLASPLFALEKHLGYYYPEVTSEEAFNRDLIAGPEVNRDVRVDFITQLTEAQLAAPESPRFVFFAKGDEAERLILIALDDQVFKTLFRARALLAQMTSNMRGSGFFADMDLQYEATFLDMLQMLEFDELVVSDGETWSHRVTLIRE